MKHSYIALLVVHDVHLPTRYRKTIITYHWIFRETIIYLVTCKFFDIIIAHVQHRIYRNILLYMIALLFSFCFSTGEGLEVYLY